MADECVKVNLKKRLKCPPNVTVSGDAIASSGGQFYLVRFTDPLNPHLNYFECAIEESGKHEPAVGIGVGDKGYSASAMPGWNPISCGYHSDDGKLFMGQGTGRPFAPTCSAGDTMGCGVEFEGQEEGYVGVFFTKNGQQVGSLAKMKRPFSGLYPLLGLHSDGDKVRYLGHSRREADAVGRPMEVGEDHLWLRSNGVRFLDDGLTLEYAGSERSGETDCAVAQSRYRLSAARHYFEIEILAEGKEEGGGGGGVVVIGVGGISCPLHLHPGQTAHSSVGYRSSDGCVLCKSARKDSPPGPTCTVGDRMGCGLKFTSSSPGDGAESKDLDSLDASEPESDSEEGEELELEHEMELPFRVPWMFRRPVKPVMKSRPREHTPGHAPNLSDPTCVVFFTKNGDVVGEVELRVPSSGLYPMVSMETRGEQVRVDFHPLTG